MVPINSSGFHNKPRVFPISLRNGLPARYPQVFGGHWILVSSSAWGIQSIYHKKMWWMGFQRARKRLEMCLKNIFIYSIYNIIYDNCFFKSFVSIHTYTKHIYVFWPLSVIDSQPSMIQFTPWSNPSPSEKRQRVDLVRRVHGLTYFPPKNPEGSIGQIMAEHSQKQTMRHIHVEANKRLIRLWTGHHFNLQTLFLTPPCVALRRNGFCAAGRSLCQAPQFQVLHGAEWQWDKGK